jgi:hypothetical protein
VKTKKDKIVSENIRYELNISSTNYNDKEITTEENGPNISSERKSDRQPKLGLEYRNKQLPT